MAFAGILNFLLCEGVSSAQRRHYKKSVNIVCQKTNKFIFVTDKLIINSSVFKKFIYRLK
jgi:hypothetical protein